MGRQGGPWEIGGPPAPRPGGSRSPTDYLDSRWAGAALSGIEGSRLNFSYQMEGCLRVSCLFKVDIVLVEFAFYGAPAQPTMWVGKVCSIADF